MRLRWHDTLTTVTTETWPNAKTPGSALQMTSQTPDHEGLCSTYVYICKLVYALLSMYQNFAYHMQILNTYSAV